MIDPFGIAIGRMYGLSAATLKVSGGLCMDSKPGQNQCVQFKVLDIRNTFDVVANFFRSF